MNTITKVLVVAVVVGGVAFYGGMKYSAANAASQRANLRSQFSVGAGGQFFTRTGGGMGMNGGFTAGQIISKDATSLTIKMANGSTKIVLYGSSTEISKFDAGTLNDLTVGQTVSVQGTANSDGSLSANSIQLRPPMPSRSPSPSPTQ